MPTLQENKTIFDGKYNWNNGGEEWSAGWGDSSFQWYGTILPRIHPHVPADRILEIACGFGRWTSYLKDLCKNLAVVDLSHQCIDACRERFSSRSNIEYHVNDGLSLDMIATSSIDFVFSFDSLVHADETVMNAYLSQLKRILTDEGVAFIHHSNLRDYRKIYPHTETVLSFGKFLSRLGLLEKEVYLSWRDFSVSAKSIALSAEKYGLACISQELIHWGTRKTYNDCLSTIVKSDSLLARPNCVIKNKNFPSEMRNLLQLSQLYNFQRGLIARM
ncbi:MAG: class I SAM-dependent methyltransferase [Deltaproteobacteria bacterium]|nr:class I SAM-dependent methyltransferase [Deltaproteobacteria bacterium]